MGKATLVIMAAGIGSRFGGGIKQLEPVGPNGEIIMDYSIYDAMEAGFDKVVFVIRKDLEKDFKEVIGNRVEKRVEVAYAYQELSDIPKAYQETFRARTKPWGTGQAILACKDVVKEPFLVINADDYYGKEAYVEAYQYLTTAKTESDKLQLCMVGFVLKNTLSENGTVTRGVCHTDADQMLTDIKETHGVEKFDDTQALVSGETGELYKIDIDSQVSMNMWGMTPEFFTMLEEGFVDFLDRLEKDDLKSEYLLPTYIGEELKKGTLTVQVLHSADKWFGVTYKEDKAFVTRAIKELIETGAYDA